MRRLLLPTLALVLALHACAGAPTTPGGGGPGGKKPPTATAGTPRPGGPTAPEPGATGKPAIGPTGSPGPLPGSTLAGRPIAQVGEAMQLTGKVKLLSNNGGGIISNHGGSVIANNGGSVIANNGGSLNGSVGTGSLGTAYRLAQAAQAPGEALLADAVVEVHDARGQVLVGPDGQPLAATTDAQGGYALRAVLPNENLVLRVKLWNGGELSAILPREGAKARELPIDTAATLGATYVLTQFVKGDQATFDKLPASEAARLQATLDAAKARLGKVPSYKADELVSLTDDLRKQDPTVDRTLSDIKALLIGQANLGAGRKATEVPLLDLSSVVRLPDGSLLAGEQYIGRLRRIAPDGTLTTWADALQGDFVKENFFGLWDLLLAPDGALIAVDGARNRIRRIAPDGSLSYLAGNGDGEVGPVGPRADATSLAPTGIALGQDGTLYVGEIGRSNGTVPRVFAVAKDGGIRELAAGPQAWFGDDLVDLSVGPDGTLYAAIVHPTEPDAIWALPPGGPAWKVHVPDVQMDMVGRFEVQPDGGFLVSEDPAGRLTRIAKDGTRTVLAGVGGPPGTAALKRPSGFVVEPDGAIAVADQATATLWRLKDGQLTAIAGSPAATARAADGTVAVNGPGGLVFDAQGRMILAENGSHTIKRFEGATPTIIAGTTGGFSGDGGPATAAAFSGPTGLAIDGETLWLIDLGNQRLRRIGPDGIVTTVAGASNAPSKLTAGVPAAPDAYRFIRALGLVVAPDHRPLWTMLRYHQIHRLRADGRVELVAGKGGELGADGGDGGPAAEAGLDTPLGMAFGPDGALYVADGANMRIRKITGLGEGQTPMIEAFAGAPKLETLASLGGPVDPEGIDRRQAHFAIPGGLCFDKAGNMYVSEQGTATLPLLATLGGGGFGGGLLDALPKVGPRIRKIAPDGKVTTICGMGGKFFTDPLAPDALASPTGLAVDPQGRLVIVDGGANLIRFLPAGSF